MQNSASVNSQHNPDFMKQYDPDRFFYQQLFSNREAHLKYIEEQLQKKSQVPNYTYDLQGQP